MDTTERALRALAAMLGLGVRVSRSAEGYHLQIGGTPAESREAASFGMDAVISYTSWNDRYSASGGYSIEAPEVAVYLAVWSRNRSESVHHVRYEFHRAMAA